MRGWLASSNGWIVGFIKETYDSVQEALVTICQLKYVSVLYKTIQRKDLARGLTLVGIIQQSLSAQLSHSLQR